MSKWTDVLSSEQLQTRYELTASLDRRFADQERAFYESRTAQQLHVLAAQAWNCNDADGYQMARSYAERAA